MFFRFLAEIHCTLENTSKYTSKNKFSTQNVQIPYHLHPAISYSLNFNLFVNCLIFGFKAMFFELLHTKPCRIIWKLPQKNNSDPKNTKSNQSSDFGRRRRRRLCFWLVYIIDIYRYFLYILYIFHISFLAMFHIFSLLCFLIYGVKSRSGHYRSKIVPLYE